MKKTMRVAVTGSGGQIGYSLLFRIASGGMLGQDQPVSLHLFDISSALPTLRGVVMELEDCAFPLLQDIVVTDDARVAFRDVDVALLVGSRPRSKGMERKDLLEINGAIFQEQGRMLSEVAHRDVKVLVVGNPANTNALIAMKNARELKPSNFSSMMRLDHNRALSQVARKLSVPVSSIKKMVVWGNHSTTQYPDLLQAEIKGVRVADLVGDRWMEQDFIPTVQKRGAAIIEARGLSSAASAANAIVCHVRDWVLGTPDDDWVTMGIPSDGSYGIPEGLFFGYPVTCRNGQYSIVPGLSLGEFSQNRLKQSYTELLEEKSAINHLI